MGRVDLTVKARTDLQGIWTYIAADSPDAADRLFERIYEKCRMLSDVRQAGRSCEHLGRGVRGFPVGNYMVFYRPTQNGVLVLRVIHGARDISDLL